MELVFRKLYPPRSVVPQPGEIYLLPVADRHDLANLVIEQGPDAFLHGTGPYERIVIDADAKFDDMLAASFLEERLTGRQLPPGCQPFARYAAMVRDGLRPVKFPLEISLEGIFLAIRCNAEKHLTDPETGCTFLADWSRMADVIFMAAKHGTDPFTIPMTRLIAEGGDDRMLMGSINRPETTFADFSRERGFLTSDLAVYRTDVAHGEKWRVVLPGGPPGASGVLLRQPQSVLFKYWTRSQCSAPVGGPYPFAVVTFWHGQWVFSVDPASKISLKGLADLLQAAELKQNKEHAEQDPWFDGKPTQYKVVASPRAGTVLPDDTVMKLVRKWCKARPVDGPVSRRRYVAGLLAACLTAVLALAMVFPASSGSKKLLKVHDIYVISIGVSKYAKLPNLPSAARDAEDIQAAFKKLEGTGLCKYVVTRKLTNFEATRTNILESALDAWLLNEKRPTSKSLVIITFAGHGFVHRNTKKYVFAPHDYDPATPSTGINLSLLVDYLDRLPCPVVLIFDTCHSGAIRSGDDDDSNDPDSQFKIVKKSVEDASSRYGLAIMMACARDQKANETPTWKHGALTLAFLEGMDGKYHYTNPKLDATPLPTTVNGTKIISLKEMAEYVRPRVEQLAHELYQNREQDARTFCTGNISLEQIPIAVR